MGSSSSRLGSRPRSHRERADHGRATASTRSMLSSILICGASTSHAPVEMDDDPAELLVNFREPSDSASKLQTSKKESILSATGSGFTNPKIKTEASSEGHEELVTSHQLDNCISADTASTSFEGQPSSDLVCSDGQTDTNVVYGIDDRMVSDISPVLRSPSDGTLVENHESTIIHDASVSASASFVSDSPVNFHPNRDAFQEVGLIVSESDQSQRDESAGHVDAISASPNVLSSDTTERSNHEERRTSRRLFWDAFSRHSFRRHTNSRTFVFSTDDSADLGSHGRWLFDFSGDISDDGFGGNAGYSASRTHTANERRWHSRSEIWGRLRGGIERSDRQTGICPSGLHPDGTCSCESLLTDEEPGGRASISRIVILAEALFEVLDEIHRQPVSLSLSVVSLPAPESLVDSFPVKNHMKPEKPNGGDDVAQCYICLADYDEGDRIRMLPCRHEYHMSCIDKWLKEIHGICPVCRGDVRDGYPEASISNSEITST